MPETLEGLQEFFRRDIKADIEDGTLFENKQERAQFYPDDCKRRLNEWFCEKIFNLLLLSLDPHLEPIPRKQLAQGYREAIFHRLRVTFIILFAFTTKNLTATLCKFRESLLEKHLDISDGNLPLAEKSARKYFGEDAGKTFFKQQHKLLPSTLQEGEFRQVFPVSRILPWFDEADSFLGEGAYGVVHKVKVVRGHFIFKEPSSRNADPVLLARKDFRPDGYADFQAEDKILQKLMSSTNCPSSIMQPICSVIYTAEIEGPPSSSIFFLPAKQNLWHYMTEEPKPGSDADRLRNIKGMLGICQGLDWLHRNLEYQPTEDKSQHNSYYHCDLKPDNILVCEDPSTPRSLVFRISDFGQARGLDRKSSNSRSHRPAGSMIPLRHGRGEYTYLPPECQTRDEEAFANSTTDVWSFACILLLMIVFNRGGNHDVKDFQAKRLDRSLSNEKNDRFYVVDRGKARLNPAVVEYMNYLEGTPAEAGVKCDTDLKFTQSTMKYLQKFVLVVDHKKRHKIGEVLKTLRDNFNDRPPAYAWLCPRTGAPENATYCSNLPDGKILFFSKRLLRVYKPKEVRSEGGVIKSIDVWSDLPHLRPSLKSCTISEICTVLSPIDKSRPTDAHIHQLETNDHYSILLSLGYISVDSVALTQDGALIAICSTRLKHGSYPDRVSLCQLADLKSAADRISNDPFSVTETDWGQSDILKSCNLGDSGALLDAERIVDLCFSAGGEILYCVYKIRQVEDQVRVCLWDTEKGTRITEGIIQDENPSARRGFFLQNIVPFNILKGFIYITNEDSIGIQTLHNNRLYKESEKMEGYEGLKAVLLSSNDQRLVMISQRRDGMHIYGCWIRKLHIHKPEELEIDKSTRKLRYDPLTDSVFLMDENGRLELYLTICKSQVTHVIGLDRLFVSDVDDLES